MSKQQAANLGWRLQPFPYREGRLLWIGPGEGSVGPDFHGWPSEEEALRWLEEYLTGRDGNLPEGQKA